MRAFATPARRMNQARERIQQEESHVLNEINETIDEPIQEKSSPLPNQDSSQQTVTHIPWYLQNSDSTPTPLQETTPTHLQARQRLPELPSHPPEILQPLLEQISVSLGMDDLSLLDLRTLDPPPALGANLLMIVGTARSEKHLHVSADRLCRWLRSTYSLTPFADGLLGRAELKLKMRRRAKRSRLLSAVGSKSTADSAIDDGIRTGWVCVNVGQVEGGELPENVARDQRQEGFVGFGKRTEGCRIVVQMLTEEKRGEVDLENLWTGILNRARKARELAEAEDAKGAIAEPGDAVPEETAKAQ